ncbi:midasin [Copidosoma floridanum]|uniref:midasin n=1 Tax=Copidosoma floridanum TaxID=29053 RepID=UPI0006C9B216|nr:midasin [Copidosoma floridanum]
MILQGLEKFCDRRDVYKKRFASFRGLEELSEENKTEFLQLLCSTLMNPVNAKDVAECFPQLLLILLTMSINKDKKGTFSASDDKVHKINCCVIGQLILIHPDVLGFALQYFERNPSPFENPESDTFEPPKLKRPKLDGVYNRVSDYEIVMATFNILQASTNHFKYKWKWSKFYKYLSHKEDDVKWLALKCIGLVLEMSEILQLKCAKTLLSDTDKFELDTRRNDTNVCLQKTSCTKELNDMAENISSVVSVAGVLLPVLNKETRYTNSDLIPVPSMEENLRSLALGVASRKCICLQGAVGCGKTAIVEYLAKITNHWPSNFIKVQLGDQTDSKMLLGTYRCTDIPGEFVWQAGVLTQAVASGKWLLLEDIDSAALDVASILSNVMETGTLSVPGYKDTVHVNSGFQLFVTQRLIPTMSGFQRQSSGASSLLEKHWLCINMESLSKKELITIVQTLFPVLNTFASKIVDVFLLFSVGNHNTDNDEDDELAVLKTGRLISTRDLIKWCHRAVNGFNVSSKDSALKLLQDAIDIFCCSVPFQDHRLVLATEICNKLGIVKMQADYFCRTYKPSISLSAKYFTSSRCQLERKQAKQLSLERCTAKFSFTRPSACLLERISCCVAQNEPVLLVGETGTGKTSCVQYLARSTGHKLIVINMNQQSESADLLGGYKPVDLKILISPIREEFEILFRSFFAVEPNKKFLEHIGTCFAKSKWKTLVALMNTSTGAALKRLRSKVSSISEPEDKSRETLRKWDQLAAKLRKLAAQVKSQLSLAFAFIEGSLIKALKEGHWVLLDEINLANAETLECLSGLLEGSSGSLSLLERGDQEAIARHPDFTIFACMNPATDVGKKELPVGLRNRFTEFYVDELTEHVDLQLLVGSYLEELNLPAAKQEAIVKFYLNVRQEATWTLFDGTAHKPHYSLRTLCRALSVAAANPCGNVLRSLYEAFCLSFLTQLDHKSYPIVERMIVEAILEKKNAQALLKAPIMKPKCGPNDDYIAFEGYWVIQGSLEPEIPKNYILTESVRRNLRDVARVVSIGKMPILLQGDTSVGKTSLITYLARASGHVCVRINNHEHTDLQEYVGSYVADDSGKLVFREGILVEAMRKGYWIILDELNLAPSDVLEALNRVLDDNRELFIPETQETVRAHENFMLFATQNPPGSYGGRKVLSRAFRNRFVELHFDEIPSSELEVILHERCSLSPSYCKLIIAVMQDLQVRRKNTAAFAGKQGFITLRDLFRWGERYRLAPDPRNRLYDWQQHLADEGYLVLAAKVRRPEEAEEIRQVIKTHLKRDVNPDNLFTLNDNTSPVTKPILEAISRQDSSAFGHVVWTYHMRRMAVLVRKSYQFKEPVLLVGETGGGKTTICQLISHMNNKKLFAVNCHMHTESSDFLGNLRPVRSRDSNDNETQKLFEWVDGPLIKAMMEGDFFLADEISLADDSVLERLNSLLEPERSLLLAEKGIDDVDDFKGTGNTIIAHDDFFFIGTMNPGGDYGKKELSPALRNRFTEIWCDGCTERADLRAIIEHNLAKQVKNKKTDLAECILNFVEWLAQSDVGKRFTVSIRDILSWVNFINVCTDRKKVFNLNLCDAYYHGASLTYIDSLGSGLTSMESAEKLKLFKENAFEFLQTQVQILNPTSTEDTMDLDLELPQSLDAMYGIAPFYIDRGSVAVDDSVPFTFHAPTTKDNSLKLLRALQLRKPILLEGSPGVGKTSLVSALARAAGYTCLRINLSDQTDISDLFGADLPVEGGKGGEFAWRDGPFLRALKAGHWILLDELNLASQSVLEGLNACFDHRGEVYIPELGKTFTVKSETKLFACQNPLRQGGARRGLPKSFLNRFTQVYVDALTDADLEFIAASQYPDIDKELINIMIKFNSKLAKEAGVSWGFSGAPWEMNLRDVSRWCEAMIAIAETDQTGKKVYNPGNAVELIYVDRMRSKDDKDKVKEMYKEVFSEEKYPLLPSATVNVTDTNVYFGDVALERTVTLTYSDPNLLLLRDQMPALRSVAQCVKMNWMSILVGGSGSGKSSVVRVLSQITGQKLKSIAVHSAMDTTEILGGFEQTDYNRHLEQLIDKTEGLLTSCIRTRVSKKNIGQIAKYEVLVEQVRELSHDEYESVTMAAATELFLEKIERLARLLGEMKNFKSSIITELEKLEDDLGKLKESVEQEKCLNAGGKFEWVDSVLVKCLQEGTWLVIDQVNLCSPAVLDRLNGLLEPNGVLSIGERGVDPEGNVVTVKPHKNFRLFLTMDPKYGEISRAMRNRGVEIYMLGQSESPETGKLDYRSLLHNTGLTKRKHQEALMTVHRRMCEDASNFDNLSSVHLLRGAFLVAQQLSRGFPAVRSFETACTDVYLKSRSLSHRETKHRLAGVIEETIREYEVDEDGSDDYVLDLDAVTCGLRNLTDNARLAQLRQQSTLLDWCVRGFYASNGISFGTDFVNEFFSESSDGSFPSVEVLELLPHVLLGLYEHSTLRDAGMRERWVAGVLGADSRLGSLLKKNGTLARAVMSFDLVDCDAELPWDRRAFENANTLALLLYYETLVVDREEPDWRISNDDKAISVAKFSEACRQGKMAINLKDQPLVTEYVTILRQTKKYLDNMLRKNVIIIHNPRYVQLRHSLKWFGRFCEVGKMILLNKSDSSKNALGNLDEVALVLRVHYKWLKKFIKLFDESCDVFEMDDGLERDCSALKSIMNQIDSSLTSTYDPFAKIGKVYKKHIDSALPCSSDLVLRVSSQLRSLTDSFSPTTNRYITADLINEPKFVTFQAEEVLSSRARLISLWHSVYANELLDEDIFDTLESIGKLCQNRLNVTEDSRLETKMPSSKELAKMTGKVQLWPLHEHMFTVFVEMLRRSLCESVIAETEPDSLPSIHLSTRHWSIPNIPVELLAVLSAISAKQISPVERNRLILLLFVWSTKFAEDSYALKNFKQVSRWSLVGPENKDSKALQVSEPSDRANVASGPVLVSLVSELLLNTGRSSTERSGVTLGSYSARLDQLRTLNDILWKNSVALSSPDFDRSSNDLRALTSLLKSFLCACEKVEADECVKNALGSDRLTASVRATVASEYLNPLRELRGVSELLESDPSLANRGRAWVLLGYLQAFVFGNVSYIDPVYKVAVKLRYLEQDILDSERTIYVARLYSRMLGVMDEGVLHPRHTAIEAGLKELLERKSELQKLKAVRPANAEFITLSKELSNFRAALGSYAIVGKHLRQLIDAISGSSCEDLESAKLAGREAEIWLESLRSFMNQLENRFLHGYPDIVLPILTGLAQMRHGVRALVDENSRLVAIAETGNAERLGHLVRDLVRFPSLGPGQDSLLRLASSCCSRTSRELLSACVKIDGAFVVLQEQFRLTIAGLYEFYNYVALRGSLTKDLWSELNALLQQVLLIWRQQQKELEKRELEKDSLYKSRVKVHEDLTEEEEIARELKSLFPTQREQDFADIDTAVMPSLEKKLVDEGATEDYVSLITEHDVQEVQTIHSSIVKSFTSSEWLSKAASATRPDFIEPLLQRYNAFGLLLDNFAPVLGSELAVQLHPSLNVFTQLVLCLGKGEALNPESWLSTNKKTSKPYDYYRDSNVEQVRQCAPLLDQISNRVSELLNEWPEHPALTSISIILHRINSFPVTSALSRFLTGLELLLVKMREWEETAHSGVSLQELSLSLTHQIIAWRQLELACWKDCLTTAKIRLAAQASKWWFFLYDLFESFVVKQDSTDKVGSEEILTAKKLIESLEKFMSESSLVEFEPRVQLLLTFHCHTYYLEPSVSRDELLAISWNIFKYYSQFLPLVSNQMSSIKTPIEKKLKDFVKIARWNDINYWAVKETVEKTHRTLHKFIKEYENGLKEPVTPFLVVKPNYKTTQGIWDRPSTEHSTTVNLNDFISLLPTTEPDSSAPSSNKSDVISRVDSHYFTRAKKLCRDIISCSKYPDLRVSLEEFIEEYVDYSERLRTQEINRTLPKPKQKSQAKAILTRKRTALADYFKTLTNYGVSQRVGSLAWKNKVEDVLDFTIAPIEVTAALSSASFGAVDKKVLEQWEGCERYYYNSLIKLNALNRTLLSSKTDLGIQNIESCRGFSTHLMLMANSQKKTLASVLKYFAGLRSHVFNLSNVEVEDLVITKQNDLSVSVNSLKELLVTVQTCLEQFLIYLQACPTEIQLEGEDDSYSLASNNLPIVNCKKGDADWTKANEQIKRCLAAVVDVSKKFVDTFPDSYAIHSEHYENESQISIITSKHFSFMKSSFNSLKTVKDTINDFAASFKVSYQEKHPLLDNIVFLESSISRKLKEFDEITASLEQQSMTDVPSHEDDSMEEYEKEIEKLVNNVLIVIQNKYKKKPVKKQVKANQNENEEEDEEEDVPNKLRERLVESIEVDVKSLQVKEVYLNLNNLLKAIRNADPAIAVNYSRLLKKCLPLLQQYLLLAQYFLSEQVASLRITCKILHKQLNVFLDLAANGFCMPKDLDLEEGDDGEQSEQKGGMGLGDGEGEKDVSETIETEDQLEDAKPAGQEKEKPDDKEMPEEEKGIEMSEDFEGQLQDVEKKEDDEEDNKEEEDEDIDKQMGETEDGADKLDEQIWGDDEEEPQSEETNKNEDEVGDGEKTGEKEFGAKDERGQNEDSKDKGDNDQDETEREQQKEINEMEEPQYDDDQVNPYHGKHQPEPEPEPLDLPDNADMNDEDEDMKDEEQQNEENPFDIDKMKEAMPPPEEEVKEPENLDEEMKDEAENKNADSSDDEGDSEKPGERTDKEDVANEEEEADKETDKQGPEAAKENQGEDEEGKKEEEPESQAVPSMDESAMETDAADQVDQREGGSRDQVANQAETKLDEPDDESKAENWQEEQKDKGTGQSHAEQHDAGHSGASEEKSDPTANRDVEMERDKKRQHPGKSDEDHKLAEKIEPDKKKVKTMIYSQDETGGNEDDKEEGAEPEDKGDPDLCQHVKEKEKFDHYAVDAATEEQSKEQASNMEKEETPKDEEQPGDIDMHEDEEIAIDETVVKPQKPESLDEETSKDKKDSKERENDQLENATTVEGEDVKTANVPRGGDSVFVTNLTELEVEALSSKQIEQRRLEVEMMLSQWQQVPTTEEAVEAWNTLSSVTDAAARDLSEKLRLVLEPTQASRLKGDYRTGRRINMRKIIPYIASQFRKDKIWMRRTKPSKRDYQIILAIDDSSSMADNHSKELAFESLSLISKAMTYLEAGQLGVVSFGEKTSILHPLGETFSERSGSRLMQEMRFEQKRTMVHQLVDFTVDMFQSLNSSSDNAKLLIILSDGRGVDSEGMQKVNRAVRRARLADIFLVFIIVDNPLSKSSILDIKRPIFQDGKVAGMSLYMDDFPFPFYMILRDINTLPGVLSDALRQWFEVVGKIDS